MVRWAKDRGLLVVPWSFQTEAMYVPSQFDGDDVSELQFFYGCLGVASLFHEFPDRAVEVVGRCRDAHRKNGNGCTALCPRAV